MPSAKTRISRAMKAALHECFHQATRLVPAPLRPQFILVGGAASIAHSSVLFTNDVDVAASREAHYAFMEAVRDAPSFKKVQDSLVQYNSTLGIQVQIKILELGGSNVDWISTSMLLWGGHVASKPDLLVLRAATVVSRGGDGDLADLQWLLEEVVKGGELLPGLEREGDGGLRRGELVSAASRLTHGERYILSGILNSTDICIMDSILS